MTPERLLDELRRRGVRVWADDGRPEGQETLGSYEAWARVIGGILRVSGVSGFLSGRERLYSESDRETAEWRALCEAWWETYGGHPVTAKDVFEVAKERGLLLDLWGGRRDLAAQQRIGHALASMRDGVFGGLRIRSAGRDSHTNSAAYRLKEVSASGNPQTTETPETMRATEGDGRVSVVSGVRGFTGAETKAPASGEGGLRFRPWAADLPPELKGGMSA